MSKKKRTILLAGIILILGLIMLILFSFGREKKQSEIVGMVTTGSIYENGWSKYHYNGLEKASEGFEVDLRIKQNVKENSGECVQAVEELIQEGAKLVILGSFNYQQEIRDLIDQNPAIRFYACSSSMNESNVSTYSVRAYQARYLAGIVAGCQTKNARIGYVAAMPNSEVNRGINAFTLGAQSVNPEIEVYVIWTGNWNDEEAEKRAVNTLVNNVGIDLVTCHQNQNHVVDAAEENGIYSIGYHEYVEGYSNHYLTAVEESWDNVYKEILKEYMQGQEINNHLIWLGIEKNAVGLASYSALVDEKTLQLVDEATRRLENGWEVFSDTIVADDGTVKCQENEVISDDVLFSKMDWLVRGVIQYDKEY